MDQTVEMAILQLDRDFERIFAADFGKVADDAQTVLDVPHMIVGHFQHEERIVEQTAHSLTF